MAFRNSWQNYEGNPRKLQISHFEPLYLVNLCKRISVEKNVNLGEQILIPTFWTHFGCILS